MDALATKRDTEEIFRRAINLTFKRLDERVLDLADYAIVDGPNNCNSNVNKSLIRRAIRNACIIFCH